MNYHTTLTFGDNTCDDARCSHWCSRVELEHTFKLANDLSEPIEIIGVKASCGCTAAVPSKNFIDAGESFSVDATLTLTHPGRRLEEVWLLLRDHEPVRLQIAGSGIRPLSLYTVQRSVVLKPGDPKRVLLVSTTTQNGAVPPTPQFKVPDGVQVSFGGWQQVFSEDPSRSRPARWHGEVKLFSRQTLDNAAKMEVYFRDSDRAFVQLSGRPWLLPIVESK